MHRRYMPPSNSNLINSNCSRSFLNKSWLLRPSNVMSSALPGALPNALHMFAIRYTVYDLSTRVASSVMLLYWNKRLVWVTNMVTVSLSWDTNMAEVLKTLYNEGFFLLKRAKYTSRQHGVTYSSTGRAMHLGWTWAFNEIWKIEVSNSSLL